MSESSSSEGNLRGAFIKSVALMEDQFTEIHSHEFKINSDLKMVEKYSDHVQSLLFEDENQFREDDDADGSGLGENEKELYRGIDEIVRIQQSELRDAQQLCEEFVEFYEEARRLRMEQFTEHNCIPDGPSTTSSTSERIRSELNSYVSNMKSIVEDVENKIVDLKNMDSKRVKWAGLGEKYMRKIERLRLFVLSLVKEFDDKINSLTKRLAGISGDDSKARMDSLLEEIDVYEGLKTCTDGFYDRVEEVGVNMMNAWKQNEGELIEIEDELESAKEMSRMMQGDPEESKEFVSNVEIIEEKYVEQSKKLFIILDGNMKDVDSVVANLLGECAEKLKSMEVVKDEEKKKLYEEAISKVVKMIPFIRCVELLMVASAAHLNELLKGDLEAVKSVDYNFYSDNKKKFEAELKEVETLINDVRECKQKLLDVKYNAGFMFLASSVEQSDELKKVWENGCEDFVKSWNGLNPNIVKFLKDQSLFLEMRCVYSSKKMKLLEYSSSLEKAIETLEIEIEKAQFQNDICEKRLHNTNMYLDEELRAIQNKKNDLSVKLEDELDEKKKELETLRKKLKKLKLSEFRSFVNMKITDVLDAIYNKCEKLFPLGDLSEQAKNFATDKQIDELFEGGIEKMTSECEAFLFTQKLLLVKRELDSAVEKILGIDFSRSFLWNMYCGVKALLPQFLNCVQNFSELKIEISTVGLVEEEVVEPPKTPVEEKLEEKIPEVVPQAVEETQPAEEEDVKPIGYMDDEPPPQDDFMDIVDERREEPEPEHVEPPLEHNVEPPVEQQPEPVKMKPEDTVPPVVSVKKTEPNPVEETKKVEPIRKVEPVAVEEPVAVKNELVNQRSEIANPVKVNRESVKEMPIDDLLGLYGNGGQARPQKTKTPQPVAVPVVEEPKRSKTSVGDVLAFLRAPTDDAPVIDASNEPKKRTIDMGMEEESSGDVSLSLDEAKSLLVKLLEESSQKRERMKGLTVDNQQMCSNVVSELQGTEKELNEKEKTLLELKRDFIMKKIEHFVEHEEKYENINRDCLTSEEKICSEGQDVDVRATFKALKKLENDLKMIDMAREKEMQKMEREFKTKQENMSLQKEDDFEVDSKLEININSFNSLDFLCKQFSVTKFDPSKKLISRKSRIFEIDFFEGKFLNRTKKGKVQKYMIPEHLDLVERYLNNPKGLRLHFTSANHAYELLCESNRHREEFLSLARAMRPGVYSWCPPLCGEKEEVERSNTVIKGVFKKPMDYLEKDQKSDSKGGEFRLKVKRNPQEQLLVWTGTMNMCKNLPNTDDEFRNLIPLEKNYDLYVFGIQESPWKKSSDLKVYLNQCLNLKDNFRIMEATTAMRTQIFAIARTAGIVKMSGVNKSSVTFKKEKLRGSCGLTVFVNETSMVFLTSHFDTNSDARGRDYVTTCANLKLGYKGMEFFTQYDFVFWMGDFGCRSEFVGGSVNKASVLHTDPLLIDLENNQSNTDGIFYGFKEQKIEFGPTFPVMHGRVMSSHMSKPPSYSERILTRTDHESLECISYNSLMTSFSEHCMVYSVFKLETVLMYNIIFGRKGREKEKIEFLKLNYLPESNNIVISKPKVVFLSSFSPKVEVINSQKNQTHPFWSDLELPPIFPSVYSQQLKYSSMNICVYDGKNFVCAGRLNLKDVVKSMELDELYQFSIAMFKDGKKVGDVEGEVQLRIQ